MVNYKKIYNTRAAEYDLLVSREDYPGNIRPALAAIRPLDGLCVIDLGTGTGRISRLLAPYAGQILALDRSAAMLRVASRSLEKTGFLNWELIQADNRRLPLSGNLADMVIAGWTLGHFTGWYRQSWRSEIDRCLNEVRRVLRPDGTVVILETLGTGRESPRPPTDDLASFYASLTEEYGFAMSWIRTDYQFESLDEAVYLCRFFFGDKLADCVAQDRLVFVPECTGIWWLQP